MQRREVRLRGRKISGLQIPAELLKFLLKLRFVALHVLRLRTERAADDAAENA
ncbi:MAG: hypothetical protein WA581_20605 [Candidatus Acidiferrales bacterium]